MKKLLPLMLVVLLLLTACAPQQRAELTQRNVFYAGGNGALKTALALAGYTLVEDLSKADVLVLNGEIPEALKGQAIENKGLVLIPGKKMENGVRALLGQDVTLNYAEDAVSLTNAKGVSDALLTEIVLPVGDQEGVRGRILSIKSEGGASMSTKRSPGRREC